MNQFFIYMDFGNSVEVLLGGLKTQSMNFESELVQTEDYSQDWNLFLKNTGKKNIMIEGQGIFDPDSPTDLYLKVLEAHKNSDIVKVKLENPQSLGLVGDFLIKTFVVSDEIGDAISFNISLQSTGEISFFKSS